MSSFRACTKSNWVWIIVPLCLLGLLLLYIPISLSFPIYGSIFTFWKRGSDASSTTLQPIYSSQLEPNILSLIDAFQEAHQKSALDLAFLFISNYSLCSFFPLPSSTVSSESSFGNLYCNSLNEIPNVPSSNTLAPIHIFILDSGIDASLPSKKHFNFKISVSSYVK